MRATSLPPRPELPHAIDVVIASQVWVDPIDRKDDFSDWSTALHHFRFGDGAACRATWPPVRWTGRSATTSIALDDGTVVAQTVDVLPWQSCERPT